MIVYGYLPYWEEGPESVPWEHITHLAVFDVALESDGSISDLDHWNDRAAQAVELGHAAGVSVHVCVTSFDSDTQKAVLLDAERRAKAVERLGQLVDAYGADGVNVDFEGMDPDTREEMVAFVSELKARVPEVWVATPVIDWSNAFDYAGLTREADGLFIMGYGFHWSGGDAGPNAPLYGSDTWGAYSLEWSVDDYADNGADLSKVVLGLPLYGQAWTVSDSSKVPADTRDFAGSVPMIEAMGEAAAYGRRWDEASATAWYAPSATEQVWYDDAESIALKGDWAVNEREMAGIGFWALGYDGGDTAFWAEVDAVEVPVDEEPVLAAEVVGDGSAVLVLQPGERGELRFELRNSGTTPWSAPRLEALTESGLVGGAETGPAVAPGETVTLTASVRAGQQPVRERVELGLREGDTLLEPGLSADLRVVNPYSTSGVCGSPGGAGLVLAASVATLLSRRSRREEARPR